MWSMGYVVLWRIQIHFATPHLSLQKQKYIRFFGTTPYVNSRIKLKVMTYEQENQITGLIVIGVLFVLWLLRNTPLGFLWKGVRLFLIVLFATLLANYAKKEIKNWWNKD